MSAHTTYNALCARLVVAFLLLLPVVFFSTGCITNDGNDTTSPEQNEDSTVVDPNNVDSDTVDSNKRLVYEVFNQIYELGEEAKKEISDTPDSTSSTLYNPDYKMQVFGWHADFIGNAYQNYKFKSLTSLAFHSCRLEMQYGDPAIDSSSWSSSSCRALSQEANQDSCNFLATLSSIDEAAIIRTLESGDWQDECINNLYGLVSGTPNVAGLVISFERMPFGYKEQFNAFVARLYEKFAASKKAILLAVPPARGQNKYDLKTLNQYVNQFIMLGYNYHYKGSKTAGPVSPLLYTKEWNNFNIQQGVSEYKAHGIPSHKLIVAFPYYGARWLITTENGVEKYTFVDYPEIQEIPGILNGAKPTYFEDAASASYTYTENGNEYIIYFDDALTLETKYKWVQSQKLAGIGMWTLGYDAGTDTYWDLLESKVNVLKNYGLQQVVNDPEPEFEPPLSEAEAKADIRKILKQSEVQIVLLCMVLFFAVLGAFLALTSSSVFDRILILDFRLYLKVMGIYVALILLLMLIARFVFRETKNLEPTQKVSSESIQLPLLVIALIGFLIITALSWKSFLRLNRDVP